MGAVAPTRYSRVSIGWRDSAKSLVDYDPADTGPVFSVTGDVVFTGAQTQSGAQVYSSTLSVGGATTLSSTLTVGGALTQTGAATFASTASIGGALTQTGAAAFRSTVTALGDVTATGGLFVGSAAAINELVAISSATAAISLGAIAPLESSSVQTVALSGVTRGDTIILTVDSIYPNAAANRDVHWMASSSSTVGEAHVWGVNSTLTSVTPTAATVVRLVRINHPSYI